MNAYIASKEELKDFIQRAVDEAVKKAVPEAVRRGNRKKWLKTDDVMEMMSCSRRHVQHLRDAGKLPYTQNGRLIRYDIDDVDKFLEDHKIKPFE